MITFNEWLNENHYSFGNTKPASYYRELWYKTARDFLKHWTETGNQHLTEPNIKRIGNIGDKLNKLGDEPISVNRVENIADEIADNEELRLHDYELDSAFEDLINKFKEKINEDPDE